MDERTYRVEVSPCAATMLASHAAFLARVSVPAAEGLTAAFQRAARSLETLPLRGPWFNQHYIPRNRYRFLLFESRYMLLYQVKADTVYIDYVLDCRQEYGFLLESR